MSDQWFQRLQSTTPTTVTKKLTAQCPICRCKQTQALDRSPWCHHCASGLPWIQQSCWQCAQTLHGAPTNTLICGKCTYKKPYFDKTIGLFEYKFPLNKIINHFKYRKRPEIAHWLIPNLKSLILHSYAHDEMPKVVTCIPLHPLKHIYRGYNQSALLAKPLCKQLNLPCNAKLLKRIRSTTTQTKLHKHQRLNNQLHAFSCCHSLKDKHIAIIDDVMTTGATANAAAKTLKDAGASRVDIWVIARA